MIRFDRSDFQRFAVSAMGALVFSTACITAAVGPAKAADVNAPLTVGDWRADVERQIDATMRMPALRDGDAAAATVAIAIGADGQLAGVTLARSSHDAAADAEALRTARAVSYPALPAGLRGRPQTIAMQLYFGPSEAQARQLATAADRRAKADDTKSAALPQG